MNTDIRLSVGFWQHPKTKKTVKRLGLEGIRSLQVLWLWAAVNRPDGVLSGMDWEDIELAADWQGDERTFFECCLGTEGASMWIDEDECGYILHDWADHNPWQAEAEARSESARKAAKARWGNADASKAQKGKDADAMRSQCAGNADASKAQCPSPLLSSPKPKGNKKESYDSSPEQSSIAAGSEAEGSLAVVVELPLNTGEEHPVTQGEIDQWKDLYPSVDVVQALRNMRGWLIGNAKRRKTKSGIGRFIQAWLAKEQDNPRASPPARLGPSRNGNVYNDGRERDYGQSDFGALGGST
jgi:hypothetical protein